MQYRDAILWYVINELPSELNYITAIKPLLCPILVVMDRTLGENLSGFVDLENYALAASTEL